jgi:hypothetical protein
MAAVPLAFAPGSEAPGAADKRPPWERHGDFVLVVALVLLTAVYAAIVGMGRYPEEDAAMLLRYARHLAEGRGIVWNVGEAPVDGATDLVFLFLVAAVTRLGASVEAAAKGVGFSAHALTVALVFLAVRRLHGAARPLALLCAAWIAFGPGVRYVAASYGTTVFTLAVALAWWAATRLAQAGAGDVRRRGAWFAAVGLLLGLARPEGAFLAVFLLAGVLLTRHGAGTAAILRTFVLVFCVLGVAYFVWRWWYFGHPLPNPFYTRGGGHLHREVLVRAFVNIVRLGGPFLVLAAAGLVLSDTRETALGVILPVVAFGLLWVFFSDEANYYMRYRYPVVPILVIGWVPVAQAWWARRSARIWGPWPAAASAAVALAGLAAIAAVQHVRFRAVVPQRTGLYDVGHRLAPFRGKHYALVTTEAGLLPLYSDWPAVDAWGLNDAWIARHGGITEEYLDRYRPEVVMFHAYFSPLTGERAREGRGLGPAWNAMVDTLKHYAESHGYERAAVYAKSPDEAHYYYVRPGFLDHAAVVAAVHEPGYLWDGRSAEDVTSEPAAR